MKLKKSHLFINCPRCELVNAIENKYCSKCSYPLKPQAFDEIKASENIKINSLEKKVEETNHQDVTNYIDNSTNSIT